MRRLDKKKVKERASGHWLEILRALGGDELTEALDNVGKKVTCPFHGGKNDGVRQKQLLMGIGGAENLLRSGTTSIAVSIISFEAISRIWITVLRPANRRRRSRSRRSYRYGRNSVVDGKLFEVEPAVSPFFRKAHCLIE